MIGTADSVLIRELSLIQRQICTQLCVVGTADSVLIRELSLIQRQICTQLCVIGTADSEVPIISKLPIRSGFTALYHSLYLHAILWQRSCQVQNC